VPPTATLTPVRWRTALDGLLTRIRDLSPADRRRLSLAGAEAYRTDTDRWEAATTATYRTLAAARRIHLEGDHRDLHGSGPAWDLIQEAEDILDFGEALALAVAAADLIHTATFRRLFSHAAELLEPRA
jgi:hypothetical protein